MAIQIWGRGTCFWSLILLYHNKFDNSDDELDDLRRKQLAEIAELQNEIDVVNARLQSMEKQRARLSAETDSARADADSLAQQAHQLEKRQRAHEKQVLLILV